MNTRRLLGSVLLAAGHCAVAALIVPEGAAAEAGWMPRGLQGRSISSLVVDSGSPSRIYAAAGDDGIFRSADGGETWTRVSLGRSVEKLELDQWDPGTLYAIVGDRFRKDLYRSTDRGTTWTNVPIGGPGWNGWEWTGFSSSIPVWSVAVDPNEPAVLHAGHSGAGVSTSRDGGRTWSWSQFNYGCTDFCQESITTLALDPSSPSTIYAGIDADYDYPGLAELFKSTDGGKSWKQSDTGLVLSSSVYSIAVDPTDSQRVLAGTSGYAGSSSGTYLSVDAGQTWGKTADPAVRAFAFDAWNPQVVYAGTDRDGVLRSTNGGTLWSPMNSGLANMKILSLVVDRGRGRLLAGTRGGVYSYPIASVMGETCGVFTDITDASLCPFVLGIASAGITTGCTSTSYCPDDNVFRLQVAVFLARAQAGGDGNVPSSGVARARSYNCAAEGTSLFSDIRPTDPFCRHVHYIYGTYVTTGTEPGKFSPELYVSRGQMALFIARAIAGGDAAVPVHYGPDPVTGRSYSCNPSSPKLHFIDISADDQFCSHIHYLWATQVNIGTDDNTYQPSSNVTRADMAKFLATGFRVPM